MKMNLQVSESDVAILKRSLHLRVKQIVQEETNQVELQLDEVYDLITRIENLEKFQSQLNGK